MALGHLNGDEKLDLIIATESTITLFEWSKEDKDFVKHSTCNTKEAFGSDQNRTQGTNPAIELGDLDGKNSTLDLAIVTQGYTDTTNDYVNGNIHILFDVFDNLSSCDEQKRHLGQASYDNVEVSLVDVNGDGAIDISTGTDLFLQTASSFEKAALFNENLEDAISSFYRRRQSYNEAHAWGDVDGDGDLDVVLTGKEQSIRLHLNNSQLHSNTDSTFTFPTGEKTISWADINNDGFYDYISSHANERYWIALGNANGIGVKSDMHHALPSIPESELRPYSRVFAWADVNDDSFLDFAVSTLSKRYIYSSINRMALLQRLVGKT